MTARTDPQDYRAAIPVDDINCGFAAPGRNHRERRQIPDDIMALASAMVVDQLAARFTAWRRELGFDEGRDDR